MSSEEKHFLYFNCILGEKNTILQYLLLCSNGERTLHNIVAITKVKRFSLLRLFDGTEKQHSEHIMNTTIYIWIGKKPPAPRKGVLMRSCISIILLSKQSPACWLFPGQGWIHETYFVTRWRHVQQKRLVFRRVEATGMCATESKEPLPMPEAFSSFVLDERISER